MNVINIDNKRAQSSVGIAYPSSGTSSLKNHEKFCCFFYVTKNL